MCWVLMVGWFEGCVACKQSCITTGNSAIRSANPENPILEPNKVNWMIRRRDITMRLSRHLGFAQTGNSAIWFADPENPTVKPNMKWIGRPLTQIWPFEIFPNVRSVVGRSSVLNIYFLHCSHILLFAMLGTWCARGVKIGRLNWNQT